jgi:hypothetical protein
MLLCIQYILLDLLSPTAIKSDILSPRNGSKKDSTTLQRIAST